MEGEPRSRKADFGREKHVPISLRKRSFQEKKVKSESLTYSASGSLGERSLDGMIVVGKGCNFMKSRSLESGHYLHEYHSETSLRPVTSEVKLRENVPSEGLEIGLPAYQTASSTSFTSAKSDISNTDVLQKRIHEMENEISGKNAMIARLKREVGKEGGCDLNSTSVETELTFEIMEDYENRLKILKKCVSDRDKKITELTLKLEETIKTQSLQAEENKGLTHEINLLNRQLQSMHELIHSQHWEKNRDPKEVAKYETRITELEFTLSKQDALLNELHRTIEKHDFSLKSKEKELKAKSQELSDFKNKSNVEIRKLLEQIDSMGKDSSKSKQNPEYSESIQKISNLPKDLIDRIIKLCETGEINAVKNYVEQRDTFERKLSTIREEHDNEIKRLTDIQDSKLNFLKKEIEMLNEQLRERNAMLETYENELALYRSDSRPMAKNEDLDSLKELFNAEIASQKQIHKLEMDLFEEKVKRLSDDILYAAKNEEMHLQELQSAKASANSFKQKYEQLLEEWEDKTKMKIPEGTFVDEMELDDIVDQFKTLVTTLKKTEEIHQEKVKHLQNLHEDEIGMYQREIDMFRMKLEQVDRFQVRQVELDDEVKELIRNVEINFTKTVQSITKNHEIELKLKQTEVETLERKYLEEIHSLKEKQEIEVKELNNKLEEFKDPDEAKADSEECKSLKHQIEELTVELLKCEGTIAVKEEIENALNDRVKELENLIQFKEDNCRKELQDLLSKYMKVQTLLSAKEEIAKELEDKLKETQHLLEKSRSETEELDQTCVKLKENIQKVENEKNERRIHFLEENSNDQHDPVDHSSKVSIDCQVDIPRVDSLETLQYMMRCGELEKENEDLKFEIDRLKNNLIELDVEKDFILEKAKSRSSTHDEMTIKFKNIQEELADLVSQKNSLLSTVKSLEEERRSLLEEIRSSKEEMESIREKLKSNHQDLDLVADLKGQNEKLNIHVKSLTEKIKELNAENEKLILELERYQKNSKELKNELEEAWTQRCEVEDQLVEVRKENTLLNLTKNQLENTNKRISSLVSEGTPSIVSWLKIHQTVENIVDEVLALKTSFAGENNSGNNNVVRTKSELKLLTESLNLQLENKTKLCNELLIQKKNLEKELKILEELLMQSENNFLNLKSKYDSDLRNRNLAIRRLQLELKNKQLFEIPRGKIVDQKIKIAIDEDQLERIKLSTEETYIITKKRLKKHFEDQQKSREAELKEALSQEIKFLKKEIKKLEHEIKIKDDALNDKTDIEKQELEVLRAKYQSEIDHLTEEHKTELEKLRSILERVQETGNSSLIIHKMEEEHARAMEELRTYYEKKCADLEKQFSEEVYRQQSRKMSICSSVSESDFPTDLDSTDTINQVFEQIERKKKDQIVENCRNLLVEEESLDERKKKLENFLQELLNSHNKELNYLHVKYNKEISNLEAKHTSEMNRINLELSETRKSIEIEKKIFEINLGNELRKNLTDAIHMEVREKFDEEKDTGDRLGIMKEMKSFGEDELNGESSKNFEQLANFYRNLYETALRKFEERQEQAIRNQREVIEEYEKQIQELKEAHRNELQQQISEERAKWEKFRMRERELESELSSIKSTYEDELLELRKCCQDTLQEQVNLAKADALNSLQQQIQDFLEKNDTGDPLSQELLELEERFAGKYKKEIVDLKAKHQGEVMRIKSEFEDKINRRYSTGNMPNKRNSLNDMKTDDDKLEIIRERDALKDTVGNLRHVLSEFVRYIGICEDELNSTLAGEIGQAEETLYKSVVFDKDHLNDTDCSMISKRVHLAPNISGILSQVNESSLLNASLQIRFELDKCLKQLKNDANCLLALSNPSKKDSENINGVLKKLEVEKKTLEEKVCAVEEMQKVIRTEVNQTKEKVLEWERNREVVTEGFGEEIVSPPTISTMSELKNKAQNLKIDQCNQPSNILSLLEDICKEGDRLQEESRKEKFELQQQVEVADKQLKLFKKFLDEQAAEREQERDDFLNEIEKLTEALRVKEKDSSLQERTNKDVEALESQLKEAQARCEELEGAKTVAEKKLKEAVDKVWSLRDIIQELEKQAACNSQREKNLENKVKDLEQYIKQQLDIHQVMVTELDSLKSQNQTEMNDYVESLEKELFNLRRLAEQTTPEALSQIKSNLREIESALVRKTKDLEQFHATSANVSCSSPSEDVSIREHLDATRCPTPDEMQCQEQPRGGLLLDEIDRIHEKLTRHTRAEEVALKSIRDLEMQLKNNRKALEEVQTERDVLLERVEKYLQENTSLKARLDEQRCNAGIVQRQLSSDLENQIKRLEAEIEKLNTLCLQKDKQLRDMSALLEQTKKSLQKRETEALNKSKEENALIARLKTDLQNSDSKRKELEEKYRKMSEKVQDNATMPNLMDVLLEEKNAEIDQLRKEVLKLSGQRAASSHLNSKAFTDTMNARRTKFSEPDSFVGEFISPILNDNISCMRSASDSFADLKISNVRLYKPLVCLSTPESLSSIGALQLSPRGVDPSRQNGWNPNQKSLPLISENTSINEDVASLKKQLEEKTEELKKYESQLSERSVMDNEIEKIKDQLQSTMKTVEEDKQSYIQQFAAWVETENKLQSEIDSKRRTVSEQLVEIDTLRQELMKANEEFDDLKLRYDKDINDKNEEIEKLKIKCVALEEAIELNTEEKKELKNELNFEKNRIDNALKEILILEATKVEIEQKFYSIRDDYSDKINEEQKLNAKLKSEAADLRKKNLELVENFSQIKNELETTGKLISDYASELSNVREENKKIKDNYLKLQRDLQIYLDNAANRFEVGVQIQVEKIDGSTQTYENVEMALVPLKKYDQCEEFNEFQESIQKLRCEIGLWEEKINEGEMKTDEALSFLALVRTLLTRIFDNLDDHFYELQTYRKKMMECSVDDLTDRVQRELLLSAKLDNELLSNFQNVKPVELSEDHLEKGDNLIIPKQVNFVNVTLKISELEANLQNAFDKNNDLQARVLDVEFEKEELQKRIEKLRNFIKLLEDSLAKEKKKLAMEKSRYDEDAKLMEQLRVNFENGMAKIEKLEMELKNERQQRELLEKQVKASDGVQLDPENQTISDLRRQLESERQKIISLGITVEKEKRKCQELRASLEREKLDRLTEKDVQRLMGTDLALLQEQKENLESQLWHAREMLKSRGEEVASLKRKISLMEIDLKALASSNEHQLDKDSEQSVMAEKINSLEQELDFYRSEVFALTEKPEREISPHLLLKMKSLSSCVKEHVKESNEMGEALLHLTQETEQMKSLIRKLEESTEHNSVKSGDDTLLADTDMERKSWMTEKERLISELEAVRNEYEALKQDSIDTFKSNEMLKFEIKKLIKEVENLKVELANHEKSENCMSETRVVHLFGKYMRAESYRKALAWQKRYLLLVISGYEESEEVALLKFRGVFNKKKELKELKTSNSVKTPKMRFKGAAMVFVAIWRMQYLVKRWRYGRLSGVQNMLGRLEALPAKNKAINRPTSTISLTNGPIDPLAYQTHNFVRPRSQPSPIAIRNPRELDLRTQFFSPNREVAQCKTAF